MPWGGELEDWWHTLTYSHSARVPPCIKDLLVKLVLENMAISQGSPSHMRNSMGRAALECWVSRHPGPSSLSKPTQVQKRRSWESKRRLVLESFDLQLEEAILVWHIATNVYLHRYRQKRMDGGSERQEDGDDLVEAVEALSDYMVFLLAARPYMLPPLASLTGYVKVCTYLIGIRRSHNLSSIEDLVHDVRITNVHIRQNSDERS